MEATRIVEAIKESGVKRIAFIDDAFDRPDVKELDWGAILSFLETLAVEIKEESRISDDLLKDAQNSIQTSNYTSPELERCLDLLYDAYARKSDAKFDPGYFETNRKTTLNAVRPLLQLVGDCGPEIEVMTFGTRAAPAGDEGIQVVFVDFYMDPAIAPNKKPSEAVGDLAIEQSLEKIKPLMSLHPAVILMSSHDASARANKYRQSIASRVYASRFGFVEKGKFRRKAGRALVEPEVSDVLLDVFQGYKFGRGLYQTLESWEESAKKAVSVMADGLAELELRDISYLMRFRLGDEGQNLSEYLEWLLGECLIDELGKKFDGETSSGDALMLTSEEAAKIEGAFDGPTKTVARLYHNVRVEDSRRNARQNFRLGDLYYRSADAAKRIKEHVVAVMNPDCDLVWRPTGVNPGRSATNLLLVRGDLQDFESSSTSIGDFVFIDEKARNIRWNYKAFQTSPFEGVFEKPGQSNSDYRYIGALRPIYAQEIQANLLNQMGRVGVAVPPAIAFAAQLSLSFADAGGKITSQVLEAEGGPLGYLVPARTAGGVTRVVFRRGFVRVLQAGMAKIPADGLSDPAKRHLKSFGKDDVELKMKKLCSAGVLLGDVTDYGIVFSGEAGRRPNGGPWCWITALPATVIRPEPTPPTPIKIGSAGAKTAKASAAKEVPVADALTREETATGATREQPKADKTEVAAEGSAEGGSGSH